MIASYAQSIRLYKKLLIILDENVNNVQFI